MTTTSSAAGRAAPNGGPPTLSGTLGPGAIVFMVVAAAAPLTVIAGTVPLGIAVGNGAAYPASYVVCTVVLLLFAVGFTTMAKHVPGAGAFYTYITRGLGRHAGLGSAFLALLSYTAVQGAVYGYMGAAINDFVTTHGGPEIPWYAYAVAVMAVVATLGYRHIDLSGKILGVLLICEVGVVLVIDAAVIAYGGGETGLSTAALNPGEFFSGAPGIALIFAIAGYIGFEATAVFRDEARDPARTIPRATYLALIIIGVFYAVSSWAMVSAWGDDGAVAIATDNPEGMITETATRYVGAVAGDLVQILLISSLFAALLAFHNVLARYIFSLANSSALPARCGRAHVKHSSPYIASVVQTVSALVLVLVSAVAGLDPVTEVFAWFAGVSSVGIVALMTITSVAVLVYFQRNDVISRPWNTVVAPLLGLVGLAALLVMTVINLPLLVGGSTTLAALIAVLLVGVFLGGVVVAVLRPHAASIDSTQNKEPAR
ncbi:APC family permease [Rhodococcus fascians]|uniref:APC family permease n=1 Tax=Rhodococcoides fascians TaxID=1828 RepID=UPI00195A62B1|nr:APC family permease [Rhodococcus fascians]MBM7241677.1 APC family permease [Rhodococcus fascians]MBY3808381.1 APC family permease [Rhodococcus fascians]MBY3839825.1 APC family permease [Rhodococcus fascians]MBY3846688.1 APC family permease [Rhodococcus fascians]MBY3848974.1 APC family permease [Rhodococcus fascians]